MSVVSLDTVEVAEAESCKTLAQVYHPPARRLVGRVCRAYLDTHTLTASELVSHVPYQQRMSENAQDMQRAVQLLSGAQARVFNLDLHKRMRHIFKMADAVAERIGKLRERMGSIGFVPGEFSALYGSLRSKVQEEELEMAACIALTEHLMGCEGYDGRIQKLLELMDAETDEEARSHIDSFVADIIDSPVALRTIMGSRRVLGERMSELIGLYRGRFQPTDPNESWPLAEKLNKMLGARTMEHTRKSLRLQMLRAMEAGTPVSRQTGLVELMALCTLYAELQMDGEVIGGEDMEKHLETRMSRQVSHDSLGLLLEDKETLLEKIRVLLDLREQVIGSGNIKQINEYIKYQFERRTFGEELLKHGGDGISGRLKVVADLWTTINENEFPEGLKERFLIQLEEIQMTFLKDNKIFAKLNQGSKSPAQAMIKMVDMVRNGLFTGGQNLTYVQNLIRHQLSRKEVIDSYLAGSDGAEREKRLAVLRKRLSEAGIADNPAA